MNREIRFKGRRKSNEEWVYGCLTRYSEEVSYITVDLIQGVVYQVYAKSVGQYTGLRDSKRTEEYPKGQPIYEGDILDNSFAVIWEDEHGCWTAISPEKECIAVIDFSTTTISGNIHDNPELLEGEVTCIKIF